MKSLLLDSNVWLWMNFDSGRLKPGPVRDALEDAGNELYLSLASMWEMTIKYGLGKLELPEPPRTLFASRLARHSIQTLPIGMQHVTYVAELPNHHSDPFDRLLIAQSILESLTLVSSDRKLELYDIDLMLI